MLKSSLVPRAFCNSFQNFACNLESRLKTIELGTPWNLTIVLIFNSSSFSRLQLFIMAKKCVDFVSLSTMTQIEFMPHNDGGNPIMKSIEIESHFHARTFNSCSNHASLWCLILFLCQVKHLVTNFATSCFILLHQKVCLKSLYNLFPRGWIKKDCCELLP